MKRAFLVAATLTWIAFSVVELTRAALLGHVPGTLGGNVVQSGAAVALAALALTRGRASRLLAVPLGLAVAVSAFLGHPYRGVPGAPFLALVVAAPIVFPSRWAALASALAWAAFGALAMIADPEPRVALVSHAVPGAIALAPLLLRRVLRPPDTLKSRPAVAAPWT